MRVGCYDIADFATCLGEDLLDVSVDPGTRVDNRDLVVTDEVGVRAGTGHQAGVRRDEPPNRRVEPLDPAGLQRLGHDSSPRSSYCG